MRVLALLGRRTADAGHAVIEFIMVGMLVLVPFTLGAASVGVIQAAQVHLDAAAAEASRVYAMSASESSGRVAASAAAQVMATQMSGLGRTTTTVACISECEAEISRMRVRVEAEVRLPLLGLVRIVQAERVATLGLIR